MEEADMHEGAKISALMVMERFAEIEVFKGPQCSRFVEKYLGEIQRGMLFKIKKVLIPSLLAIAKHLKYEQFLGIVYGTYVKFASDDIWGVRKVCLERLLDLVKKIDA